MTDPYKCGRCGLPVSPGVCAPQPHVFHDRPEQCVPDLVAEVARLRTMFDVTRHRVCDALRVDRGRSWSSIEGIVADEIRQLDELRAILKPWLGLMAGGTVGTLTDELRERIESLRPSK